MNEDLKINTLENVPSGVVAKMIEKGRKMNEGKVTLKINRTMSILVKPENRTKEYAESYRVKHNITDRL